MINKQILHGIQMLLVFAITLTSCAQEGNFEMERKKMVDSQIKARGIEHKATLEAMEKVPRHLFIPEYLWGQAYRDGPLPIGEGQTISQPYIVAYMTSLIEPEKEDRVLEIGTGSGYQAAVLANIVDSVFTIEIVDALAISAEETFENLGYKNIWVKNGDGYFGWPEHAPFDKIIVTAAAEEVPPLLVEQLKEGGKMIIPVGPVFSVQYLILVEKKNGKVKQTNMLPVRFVPFTREDD
jgi:protein-L-isoaspartate(D-aspartate) O-methyltransferase